MHPILIELGPLRIYSYGFMLAMSFFAGILLAGRRAERRGVPREIIQDLSVARSSGYCDSSLSSLLLIVSITSSRWWPAVHLLGDCTASFFFFGSSSHRTASFFNRDLMRRQSSTVT